MKENASDIASLRKACEEAKINPSFDDVASVCFPSGEHVEIEITKEFFNAMMV